MAILLSPVVRCRDFSKVLSCVALRENGSCPGFFGVFFF
jgi:hypothetical protein